MTNPRFVFALLTLASCLARREPPISTSPASTASRAALVPAFPVSAGERRSIRALLDARDSDRAAERSLELVHAHPADDSALALFLHAMQQRAARDTTFAHWQRAAEEALVRASLDPSKAPLERLIAISCYWNTQQWSRVVEVGADLSPQWRTVLGDDNWALAVNYVLTSNLEIGHADHATTLFRMGWENLAGSSHVTNFLPAAQLVGMRWGDASYVAGKYSEALATYEAVHALDRGFRTPSDGRFLDDLRIREFAARYMATSPPAPEFVRTVTLLAVGKSSLSIPRSPGSVQNIDVPRKLRFENIPKFELAIRIFGDSIRALTHGAVTWELGDVVVLPDASINRTHVRMDGRSIIVAQGSPDNIEPPLSAKVREILQRSDAIFLLWPGTAKHPGYMVTNGGVTEWNVAPPGQPRSKRALWISEADWIDEPEDPAGRLHGRMCPGPLYLHHEFFHIVERAYLDASFPRRQHPYMRREAWPKDFEFGSQWDFYLQVYQKRVLPIDNLRRLTWRDGTTGFFTRFAREYHGD